MILYIITSILVSIALLINIHWLKQIEKNLRAINAVVDYLLEKDNSERR